MHGGNQISEQSVNEGVPIPKYLSDFCAVIVDACLMKKGKPNILRIYTPTSS